MTWFRLEDSFFENPKIAALSDAAQLSYLKGALYCARELTDGFIPLRKAKQFATPKSIKELVPDLWAPTADGYSIHDYLQYNPTKADVLAKRETARRRMYNKRSPGRSAEHHSENGTGPT